MNRGRLLRDSLGIALVTLVLLTVIEGVVRSAYFIRNSTVDVMLLPYTAAQDWGVIPPWIDGLRILESDPVLLWKNRPGQQRSYLDIYGPARTETDRVALLQQFIPRVPDSLQGNPVWSVSINSQGFRGREFLDEKSPSTFRIVCLGDSWTFGANVNQEHTYPQQLAALLERQHPGGSFEVLNVGVMGYSSRQGLELLNRRVLDLHPDLIVIGFGMNDAIVQGWRDKDSVGQPPNITRRWNAWLDHVESYKLARYWERRFRYKPFTIGDYLQRVASADGTPDAIWTGRVATESADYDALEAVTRVSPRDYEQNLVGMIDLARSRGVEVVLLFNELWSTPYQTVVERVARSKQVPWVNSKKLIDEVRLRAERELEARLGLPSPDTHAPAERGLVEVIFRVHADRWPVSTALFIAGNHPSLGNGVPNRVALHDDGTNGDQRAGDRVWSYAASVEPGVRLFYVYTNSGREAQWEGVDIPDLRFLRVPRAETPVPVYRPVETFGALPFQADGWHTNAAGYGLIAEAIVEVLETREKVREHLLRRAPAVTNGVAIP